MNEARTSPWAPSARWSLLTAVGVLLLYNAPALLMRGIGLGADGTLLFYPAEHALAAALARGSLPFWSPDVQAGFPLLADGQPGLLYPLNLLAVALLPTPVAHNVLLVLHQALGFWFTFLWGRVLGIGRSGSVWMALVFCVTPALKSNQVPMVETLAWAPLMFRLAERCATGATGAAIGAALVAMLQWLAGFPQLALYCALLSSVYLFARVCFAPLTWRQRVHRLLPWMLAGVLGLALAAPQLLPTYELSTLSMRAGGIRGGMAGEGSFLPLGLVTALLPSWQDFFRNAGLGDGIYFGLLPCLLALGCIVALSRRSSSTDRPPWFYPLLIMTVAALVLALGRYSPFFPIVRRVPAIGYFRIPSRFLIFAQLGLVTFFGLAWDHLFSRIRLPAALNVIRKVLSASVVVVLANAAIGYPLVRWLRPQLTRIAEQLTQRYILSDPYHVQPPSYYRAKIDALYEMLSGAVSPSSLHVWLPAAIMVTAWAVWRWSQAERRRRAWLHPVLVCLLVIDVVLLAAGTRPLSDLSVVQRMPDTAQFLKKEIGTRVCRFLWVVDEESVVLQQSGLNLLPANYSLLTGLASTGLYSPLGSAAYYRLMERVGTVNLAFGLRPVTASSLAGNRALLDLLNVCFVLSRQPLDGFTPATQIDGVTIYRNDAALPRAFAVGAAAIVASPDAAIEWVAQYPERLRDTAVLEEALPVSLDPLAAGATSVAVIEYVSDAVTISVEASQAVLLVLTDTYYPGWQARLDGETIPIYRTHGVFRAVLVPAGQHRVRFEYRAAAFWRGTAIAGLGAVILLACGGVALRRRVALSEPP